MALQASESRSLEQAAARVPWTTDFIAATLRELAEYLPRDEGPLRVLDVGAAQGITLIALSRLGHEAYGVEPWEPAIAVARELASREDVSLSLSRGTAEEIPYEAGSFDLVLASSVMEHVDDLERSLSEIHRVLRPGGAFWFFSASSVCPHQDEIRRFPLFGWYPDPVKRRVMNWARVNRPELVGNTDKPAVHWWTPWNARRRLAAAGFVEVRDRWELKRPEDLRGAKRWALALAQRRPAARLALHVVRPGCAYAARKPAER